MTPAILLPAGCNHVTVGDIPGLIAEALHPRALDGQSMAITRLMQIGSGSTAEASEDGLSPGEVSKDERPLAPEDWAYLAKVWADLPEYRDGLSAHDWAPYWDAWEATEARPWELIKFWTGTPLQDRWCRDLTAREHESALHVAASEGSLIVRSQSRTPVHGLMGDALNRCIVLAPDLIAYVAQFGIAVEVGASTPAPVQQQAQPTREVDLWLIPDPRDSKLLPYAPWGLSARYFARQLVKTDPSYLDRKGELAKAVQKALTNVSIYKRGVKKEPISTDTIRNAFSKLDFTSK